MRISRKSKNCLNCGRTLDKVYNYCPNCGQGNHDDNVSIGVLMGEFFSTYFAIDSRFGKSVKPFFIKPGYLTNRYLSGKRVSYANPIRLYLIISIFYFFVFSLVIKDAVKSSGNDDPVIKTSYDMTMLNDNDEIDDTLKFKLLKNLSNSERRDLKDELKDEETLQKFLSDLDPERQVEVRAILGDSISNQFELATIDSIVSDSTEAKDPADEDINLSVEPGFLKILEDIDYKKIERLDKEYELSDNQIYDSLNLGEQTYFNKLVATQAIRVNRADTESVADYITKNLPLMMLLLIPIFALILKLLYIRRDQLYIKHLIHALHLHSFAYFLYGVFMIVSYYIITNEDAGTLINIAGFLLVSTYAYISFLKVYKQHWFKTLVKFNIVGGIYLTAIFFFFLVEMMVSLLLF